MTTGCPQCDAVRIKAWQFSSPPQLSFVNMNTFWSGKQEGDVLNLSNYSLFYISISLIMCRCVSCLSFKVENDHTAAETERD